MVLRVYSQLWAQGSLLKELREVPEMEPRLAAGEAGALPPCFGSINASVLRVNKDGCGHHIAGISGDSLKLLSSLESGCSSFMFS